MTVDDGRITEDDLASPELRTEQVGMGASIISADMRVLLLLLSA